MNSGATSEAAMATVDEYLAKAVASIDSRFGKGFAKANPALVAAFVTACTTDYAVNWGTQALSEAVTRLSDVLSAE